MSEPFRRASDVWKVPRKFIDPNEPEQVQPKAPDPYDTLIPGGKQCDLCDGVFINLNKFFHHKHN